MSRRFGWMLVCLVGLALCAQAQEPAPAKAPASAFKDERLDPGDKPTDKELFAFGRLVYGRDDPATATAKQLMDKVSKWYLYRLTWREVHEGRDGSLGQIMEEVLGGGATTPQSKFFPTISTGSGADKEELERRDRQRAYAGRLRAVAMPHIQKVMENSLVPARINAVRFMVRFLELDQEEIVDELVKLIENPHEHDAVRVWAFKGLADFFKKPPPKDPKDAEAAKKREPRVQAAAQAILKWLEARCRMSEETLAPLKKKEEVEAIRYIRREAIRALGTCGRPLIVDIKAQRSGPVAPLLVRIAHDTEISPAASDYERVEAIYALCQLKKAASSTYQPEFAAHQIAHGIAGIAADVTTEQSDLWKFYALRMKSGFEELAKEMTASQAYYDNMRKQVDPVFLHLYQERNADSVKDLEEWLNKNPPKAQALFNRPLPESE